MAHRLERAFAPALLLAAFVAGCGGMTPVPENPPTNTPETPATATPTTTEAPKKEAKASADEGGLNREQREQMEIALRRGNDKAKNCTTVVPGAPSGEGEVKVVFDGTKGRISDVLVGPPFAGTPAEACIKRSFIGEIVLPFEGELEVPYSVKLPPGPAEAAAKDAKGKDVKGPKKEAPKK